MKLKFYLTFFIALFFSNLLKSQELYFCTEVSELGEPKDPQETWIIGKESGYLSILYHHNNLIKDTMILDIACLEDDDPMVSQWDQQVKLLPFPKQTWSSTIYEFNVAGNYKVTAYTKDYTKLVSKRLRIIQSGTERIAPEYYQFTDLQFCTHIDKGIPKDTASVFGIGPKGGVVMFYLNNQAPFRDSTINLEIRVLEDNEFKVIERMVYSVNPEMSATSFTYNFMTAGDYAVIFRNSESTMMTRGLVRIVEAE